MNQTPAASSPERLLRTANAFRESAALKAAVDLDVFTAIAEGNDTAASLAEHCGAAERGVRILCDSLTVMGFLSKDDGRYRLTEESAAFLVRGSPAYMGDIVNFLVAPPHTDAIDRLADAVRKGGVAASVAGSDVPEHPMWVEFARAMTGLQRMPAQMLAELIEFERRADVEVLDIAAGSGIFGISLALRHEAVRVTAVDWPNVLEVARENAERAGVAARHRLLPGDAFTVEFGGEFDVILLTHFLHHFSRAECERLLKKVHAALRPGGRLYALEFVPNEDRVSPPEPALFALQMLRQTPAGDAYPFSEFAQMFEQAGFPGTRAHRLPETPYTVLISVK